MNKPFNVPQFEKDFLTVCYTLEGLELNPKLQISKITDTQLKIQRIPEKRKKVLQKGPL